MPRGRRISTQFMKDPLAQQGERPDYVAAYDSEIRYMDDRFRGLYEALGWDRDTIVIVTADHGEEFWDRGMGGHAHTLQEELLRVPLIVIGGGYPAGRVEAPVGLVDVLPTLRSLVGLPRDDRNEGVSLIPALAGRARDWKDRTLFAHLVTFEEAAVHEGIIDGRWKLITTAGVVAALRHRGRPAGAAGPRAFAAGRGAPAARPLPGLRGREPDVRRAAHDAGAAAGRRRAAEGARVHQVGCKSFPQLVPGPVGAQDRLR